MSTSIIIKRIYEKPGTNDGYRMLIDRIWPRGVRKEDAKIDEWNKGIAPPAELRKWFDHKAERFDEFAKEYKKDLNGKKEELARIRKIAGEQQLCLLIAAKDEQHNQAVVLKKVLEEKQKNKPLMMIK